MKTKLTLLTVLVLFVAGSKVIAQTIPTPPDAKIFEDTANCRKYESKVKDYVDWIIKTPYAKRDAILSQKVDQFILAWASASPDVTISLGKAIEPIVNDKKDKVGYELLIAYMGSVAVYELQNPKDKNETNIEYAGLKGMLDMAKNNSDVFAKTKAVKMYQGMDAAALKKYVENCLASDKKGK